MIDGRVSCPVALRLDDVEIQLECRHAVAKRLEQRRITLFNGDEFFDILLVSARYGKDPELGGRERQVGVVRTCILIEELEQMLGSGFIRTDRATLVAAKGIHAIGRQIELINGETLDYAHRRKRQLREQLRADWRQIAQSLSDSDAPATREDYQRHYASYDSAPFAFTDIEMVFNEKRAAVDWIFRYANEALARLEKKPLEQLIDRAFGSSFPNMDDKWLRVYERTALFGETLEIIDHSPEIDTDLKIICFPTFKGHCGCILFKQAEIQTMREHTEP